MSQTERTCIGQIGSSMTITKGTIQFNMESLKAVNYSDEDKQSMVGNFITSQCQQIF